MLRKVISLVIAVTIIAAICIPVSADSRLDSALTVDDVLKELKVLEEKYGVEFFEIKEQIGDRKPISVSGLDEMENAIVAFNKSIEEEKEKVCKEEIIIVSKNNTKAINGVYTWSWWSPVNWVPPLSWSLTRNISHSHSYDWQSGNPYFIDCWDINSNISGATVLIDWEQTNQVKNIVTTVNYHDTVENTVSGYWTLGFTFEHEGITFPVGLTKPETWPTKSLRIVAG
jgi:hypothetical protein